MRGRFNGRVVGQDYTGRNTRHNGRAGMYNAVQSAFAPSLDITLANGLGPLFTYTRATTATVKDFESLIKGCLSGELRVQGARREQNWVSATDDASGWTTANGGTGTASKTANYATAPDGTTTATRLVATKGSGFGALRIGLSGTPSGTQSIQTIWIKSNTGSSQTLSLSNLNAAYAYVTATTSWQRLSSGVTTCSPTISSMELGAGGAGADASIDILVWHPSVNDVTGLSNQNPPEFISRGVLSSPYHGYFVDGVKYFSYQNGNTVSSNVVTEASGAAITGTIGYLAEGARTNLCLQSQDFATTWTVQANVTLASNNTTAPDGTTTADKLTAATTSNVDVVVFQTVTLATTTQYVLSVFVKAGSQGSAFTLFLRDNTSGNTGGAKFNPSAGTYTDAGGTSGLTTGTATVESFANGWTRYSVPVTTGANAGCSISLRLGDLTGQTSGDNHYFWGMGLEVGAFASTYIPATTAAVARNADQLTCPSAGILNFAQGAAFVKATGGGNASGRYIDLFSTYPLARSGAGGVNLTFNDGTNNETVGTLSSGAFSTPSKMMTAWGGGASAGCVDGGSVTTGLFDGALAGATLYIGGAATVETYAVIEQVKLYLTKPSAAQMQAMTS